MAQGHPAKRTGCSSRAHRERRTAVLEIVLIAQQEREGQQAIVAVDRKLTLAG